MTIRGVVTNDNTILMPWGFSIYIDDKLVVRRGGYFDYRFTAKWAMKKAVRRHSRKPYEYVIEVKEAEERI